MKNYHYYRESQPLSLSQKRKIGKMSSREAGEYLRRHTIRTDEFDKLPSEYIPLYGAYLFCPRVCKDKLMYIIKKFNK